MWTAPSCDSSQRSPYGDSSPGAGAVHHTTSRHCRHSLRSAGRSHDKLWRERQVASVRYSLLNDRKDFLNIRMVGLATAASVLCHILDHRQQSAISVWTGDDLNVYAGETSSYH